MNQLQQLLDLEQRMLDKQPPSKADIHREEWLKGPAAQLGLLREAAGWIGDQLVSWGETLRSWSSPRSQMQAS